MAPADLLVRVCSSVSTTIPLPRYGLDPDGGRSRSSARRRRTAHGRVAYGTATQSFQYDAPATTGRNTFRFDLRDAPVGGTGATGTLTVRQRRPADRQLGARRGGRHGQCRPVERRRSRARQRHRPGRQRDPVRAASRRGSAAQRCAGTVEVTADGKRIGFTANGEAGDAADFQYRIVDDRGSTDPLGAVRGHRRIGREHAGGYTDLRPAKGRVKVVVDVLRNDSDPELDPLSVRCGAEAATSPAHRSPPSTA